MVQFWSKGLPNPSCLPDAQVHVTSDWTLLMWNVAQRISDCIDTSPDISSQASSNSLSCFLLCLQVDMHV